MSFLVTARGLERGVVTVAENACRLRRSRSWTQLTEHKLWVELVACILGSQVPFELAQAAGERLEEQGLLHACMAGHSYEQLETQLRTALNEPLSVIAGRSRGSRRYRYPQLRAAHISRTAASIYGRGHSLASLLRASHDDYAARSTLVATTVGIGPKQASLFLRNIGYTDSLAILDTHVLNYLSLVGVVQRTPKTVSKLQDYSVIEGRMKEYASGLRLNLGCLDTAVWVTMRVAQKEGVEWV